MNEPEILKPLGPTEMDMSQIFSLSTYDNWHKHYIKGMYQIKTVDATQIPKERRHTPTTSYIQYTYPFSKSDELRHDFVTHDKKGIKSGLILNEMDSLALDVGHKYIRTKKAGVTDNFRLVTLVIDKVNFFHKILSNQDVKMNGYVMYVSHSCIVVGIDLFLQEKEGEWTFLGNATYVLAARTMEHKPFQVPKLSFNGEMRLMKCKTRFEYGYHIKNEWFNNKDLSIYNQPPTDQESGEIHDLLFTLYQQKQLESSERKAYVPMSRTLNTSYILIQPQRNVAAGYASGGYTLKSAYQLAFITGHLFCETQPFEFVGLDRQYFPTPALLGDGFKMEAKVTYSNKEYFRINASMTNIKESVRDSASEFNFTYKFQNGLGERKSVMPGNYVDAMMYLMNRKKMDQFML
jgi:acyl-CoA hydrolase